MIDFTLLDPEFRKLAQQLVENANNEGLDCIPNCGYRSLEIQAKIWRSSRSTSQVNAQIGSLRANACDYLADILQNVRPQLKGPWGTNAIPGLSWHNWGQAMDCLLFKDCQMIEKGDDPAYKTYGAMAKQLGLRWGGDFSTPDAGHVQLNQKEVPTLYTLQHVNNHFKKMHK